MVTSFFPRSLTVTVRRKKMVQSCSINARGNRESKKTKLSGLWDLIILSELLEKILSRLVLKDNIRASTVCKTWFEAAVSVRKWQPRPWHFYPLRESKDGTHILFDPSRSKTYMRNYPELKYSNFYYSRDGWLLVNTYYPLKLIFLFNPFTRERIYLPKGLGFYSFFSAAPTSSKFLVISFVSQLNSCLEIKTWRLGATVWTTHCFENQYLTAGEWTKCVFSNGMFYCLSTCGHLGVFDPCRETWNVLPVKPCPAGFAEPMFMMEYEGDIFVMRMHGNNDNPFLVLKLNLECNEWEEKRDLGGLTIFASTSSSLIRAGLSVEERNIIFPSRDFRVDSHLLIHLSNTSAWVEPPHSNFSL